MTAMVKKELVTASPDGRVPFADLHAQYLSIKPEIDAAIADVIAKSAFVRGPHVDAFEAAFAAAIGASHCVSCANGTDALYIAMRALDLRPGDEIITTAHSWIASSETITQAGGKVVFCDTDDDTFTIDTDRIEALITPRTVGIIPVHLYGQPADMEAVMAIAERHALWVIEDCAQAHLARYKGRTAGTFGVAGTFSFYPGKNLGAMGDAGAIVTNDADLARRMAMFARHGGLAKGDHRIEGINSRLDGLQAAVLNVKLGRLPEWTKARQTIAAYYNERLGALNGLIAPKMETGREHVFHLYVVRHRERDALARHLRSRGIQTVINYPVALPFLPAYERFGYRPEDFPVAYRNQSRILSLPMFPEISEAQFERVVGAVEDFVERAAD
ncbi:MAG: DegT/DnrJ/EryC1/StrS family aminotransferase [Pseudomonadota bacterium]|nr:DegT/DnrJ/EryC1/StrS family aminotransferase [Pseudomonadota bacterium]